MIQEDQILVKIHQISGWITLEWPYVIGENILESWNSKFDEFWHKFDLRESRCKKPLVAILVKKTFPKIFPKNDHRGHPTDSFLPNADELTNLKEIEEARVRLIHRILSQPEPKSNDRTFFTWLKNFSSSWNIFTENILPINICCKMTWWWNFKSLFKTVLEFLYSA